MRAKAFLAIETERGEEVMVSLKASGWKQTFHYNRFAFDKGIDFDSYTFKREDEQLEFEWTNWSEWEVRGPEDLLESLAAEYQLKLVEESHE